jgi:hypothetical protein
MKNQKPKQVESISPPYFSLSLIFSSLKEDFNS